VARYSGVWIPAATAWICTLTVIAADCNSLPLSQDT